MEISWEAPEYRVQEEDGSIEVCVRLRGMYAVLPTFNITLIANTAREQRGKFLVQYIIIITSVSAVRLCANHKSWTGF